jgi:hypothetical protein
MAFRLQVHANRCWSEPLAMSFTDVAAEVAVGKESEIGYRGVAHCRRVRRRLMVLMVLMVRRLSGTSSSINPERRSGLGDRSWLCGRRCNGDGAAESLRDAL